MTDLLDHSAITNEWLKFFESIGFPEKNFSNIELTKDELNIKAFDQTMKFIKEGNKNG